jgi:hypothetical protein
MKYGSSNYSVAQYASDGTIIAHYGMARFGASRYAPVPPLPAGSGYGSARYGESSYEYGDAPDCGYGVATFGSSAYGCSAD